MQNNATPIVLLKFWKDMDLEHMVPVTTLTDCREYGAALSIVRTGTSYLVLFLVCQQAFVER